MGEGNRNTALIVLVIVLVAAGGLGIVCCGGLVVFYVMAYSHDEVQRAEDWRQAMGELEERRQAIEDREDDTIRPMPLEIPTDEETPIADRVNAVKKKVVARLEEHGLSRISADIEENMQVSIRMKTERADDEHMDVGVSKIGGTPDLPEGVQWPSWNGKPTSFIAQVRLADAAAFDATEALPKTGILYFFYDAEQSTWGFDPKDRGSWKVIHFDGDIATLAEALSLTVSLFVIRSCGYRLRRRAAQQPKSDPGEIT